MGTLYVVGFGPGSEESMTALCQRRLLESEVIVGYSRYISLLRPLFPTKTFYDTGMTHELERCRTALALAREGKTVSVVSSGDSGVYGMASIIFELAQDESEQDADAPGDSTQDADAPGDSAQDDSSPGASELTIEVIPGITAATSGAALLGAPLSHDFAVVSLSDLLTPWELITRRLRAVAAGDFVLCLYNPGSKGRSEHLKRACAVLLETLPATRPCGIARNIGRENESVVLLTLGELRDFKITMTDTVFVGNSQTKNLAGYLITPRGYAHD